MTAVDQFQSAIAAAGLAVPEVIHGDGTLHRYSTNGKRSYTSGWYVLHDDGDMAAGAFGCWRAGVSHTWCSKDVNRLTPTQRSAHQQRMQAIAQQREADKAQRQQDAAGAAAKRWEAAPPAPANHPYLAKKGVQAHGARVDADGYLILPMRDTTGKLWNIERINPADPQDKRGLYGGRRIGCYFAIGKPHGVLIVCEGFATGASIHEATNHAVAVTFTAGNLLEVAQALHSKYPKLRLILAADDDAFTDGNPGMTKATEAAKAVGGYLIKPDFSGERSDKETDFNDLHQRAGLDAVNACIESAAPVAQEPAFPPLEGAGDSGAWPDPMPLPEALPPVAPFDPELLPEALRGWVMDIAERMQCPPDFMAVGAVTALSSMIGARAVVAPKQHDDWRVVPNLWGLIVGRPGVMKSPALGEVLKPLHRLELSERELWQAAHEAWELDTKVAELAGKANEKQAASLAAKDPAKARALLAPVDTPAEPTMRRYVVSDSTVEALADLLVTNPWGLLIYRDELHGLLCSMDRQGQEGARGFYLTGYDGNQGHPVDRIGRGHSYVPRVCMAMLGGIQPGKVQSYVREAVSGGAGDDGLLQRFGLAVWPDIKQEFKLVDRWPDTPAQQAAWAVFERLNGLLPATDHDPQQWRFSAEAQAIFYEWWIEFETGIRGVELHPALVSHLAKWRKLIPALALIFALVDTPDTNGVIHERELIRGLAWADYLLPHAERLYAAALVPETTGAHALLAKIKSGKLCDGDGVLWESFTPRLVAVKSWAGLNSVDSVRKAAELLADYGWLARETTPTRSAGGRPSERYLIHPALLTGGQS